MMMDNDGPTPKPICADALIADAMEALQEWATRKSVIRELWPFGSRATGIIEPDSDVDLAIALVPPKGKDDWVLQRYTRAMPGNLN
jgi:predicted nucleotidyltransferase